LTGGEWRGDGGKKGAEQSKRRRNNNGEETLGHGTMINNLLIK